jgi:protease IV
VKANQKWIIVIVLALPVLLGIAMLIGGARGGGGHASRYTSLSFKRIGLVQLHGTITESEEYVRQLQSLRLDNTIAGVLLRIDSPGGAVAPSQEIFEEVLKYRKSGKTIVISMSTVAASGGYYIASAGTKIFADPGTLTGSIGVIFTLPMIQELTKKIGVEFRVYTAGTYKDIGSPYHPMNDAEKALIQNLLKDTHDQFIDDVARGRNVPRDSIARFADGRVFTGRQARAAHLIDTLGGYTDALSWLCTSVGVSPSAKVVQRKAASSRLREFLEEESMRLFPALQQYLRPAGLYFLMPLR